MRPPADVLAAFGASAEPEPLGGGQGSAFRSGDLVLKPLDWAMSPEELEWQGTVLDAVRGDGFRVTRLRRARDGATLVDGWSAWEHVEGRHEERRWAEVIAVGEQFHSALEGVPRPALIDARTDHWAVGDRVAWGEVPHKQIKVLENASMVRRKKIGRTNFLTLNRDSLRGLSRLDNAVSHLLGQ